MRKSLRNRIIASALSAAMLLTGCGVTESSVTDITTTTTSTTTTTTTTVSAPDRLTVTDDSAFNFDTDPSNLNFTSLDDANLSQYMEDAINTNMEASFGSDDYHIDNIASIYISKEYLTELEYNSKENVFFGYSMKDLDQQFQGKRYVFTLGDDGTTVVKEFEAYDDYFIKMLKDVAIGTGVLVFCVTVSLVSAGVGAPAVSMIFAASAKTGTTMALSGGVIGGLANGIVTGIQTGDFIQSLKSAGTGAANGFKVGAISGAIAGGASETFKILKSGSKFKDAVTSGQSPQIGKASEDYVQQFYPKGETQVSYIGGEQVPMGTSGATRPDIVLQNANGSVKAIEVKNYDLTKNLSGLKKELERQVRDRVANLPAGSTQEIALVTKGRGYTKAFTDKIIDELQADLFDIYGGKIPISVW